MVHRDIKPGDILISGGWARRHAYLTDFGPTKLAAQTNGPTRSGIAVAALALGESNQPPTASHSAAGSSPARTVTVQRTPTAPGAADERGADLTLAVWPESGSAYTVLLRSTARRALAARDAGRYGGERRQAGVLRSSEFATLRPGYWVAFAAVYDSTNAAEEAIGDARAEGFDDAYVRWVSAQGQPAAEPAPGAHLFNTGRTGSEQTAAAYCRRDPDGLRCWTPNDGFTLLLDASGARRERASETSHEGLEPRSPQLGFGQTWEMDGFTCESTSTALTCTNARGRGLELPRYHGLPRYL